MPARQSASTVQISPAEAPCTKVSTLASLAPESTSSPLALELIWATSVSAKRVPLNSTVQGPPAGPLTATLPAPMLDAPSSFACSSAALALKGISVALAVVAEGFGVVKVRAKLPPMVLGPRVTVWRSLVGTLPAPSGAVKATPEPVAVAAFEIVIVPAPSASIRVCAGMPAPSILCPTSKALLVVATEAIVFEPSFTSPLPLAPPLTTPPPKVSRNSPSGPNFCTRWLVRSTIKTLPAESTATPCVSSNSPAPPPVSPPLQTSPSAGTQTSKPVPLSPGPEATTSQPQARTNSPQAVNFSIRLLFGSAT